MTTSWISLCAGLRSFQSNNFAHKCTKWSELIIQAMHLDYLFKSKHFRAPGARLVHVMFWCTPFAFISLSLATVHTAYCFVWLTEGLHITPSIFISCLQTILSDWVALETKIHQNLLNLQILFLRIQSVYIPLYLYVHIHTHTHSIF